VIGAKVDFDLASKRLLIKMVDFHPAVAVIFDLKGRPVARKEIQKASSVMEISQLPNGNYFFKLESDQGVSLRSITKY
jgi:hypothetical protein